MTLGFLKSAAKTATQPMAYAEVAALGLGVVGGQMAWANLAPYVPAAVTGLHPAVLPALELAAGVVALAAFKSARNKWLRSAGVGIAAGLAAQGAMGVLGSFGVLGAGPVAGFLAGAPVDVTEVAGFAGAPVDVEEIAGLGAVGATLY